MNSVATATGAAAAFLGANFMLVPRWLFGTGDAGAASVIFIAAVPVALALWLSMRFKPHVLGPDDTRRAVHGSVAYAVATGWGYGLRTVVSVPTVAATLSGLAAHRIVFGINTLLVLVLVRHTGMPGRRGSRHRGAVRRRDGPRRRSSPRSSPRPRCAGGAGTPPPTARSALAAIIQLGGGGAAPAGDDGRAASCSAPRARWSSCVPTPPCRSTSTTRCAATSSRSRIRCSGWRSSARSRCRPPSSPPTATRRRLVVAGAAVYLVGLAAHAAIGRRVRTPTSRAEVTPWLEPTRWSPTFGRRATNSTRSSPTCPRRAGARRPPHRAGPSRTRSPTCCGPTGSRSSPSPTKPGFGEVLTDAAANPTGFVDEGAEELAATPPAELLADWRRTRTRLHDELLARRRRPQAAVVRSADERGVDGDRAADGDLGARPRRRRRARGDPPRHRPAAVDRPHRGPHKGFRVLRARAGRAGRSVPRRADAHPTASLVVVGSRRRAATRDRFRGGLLHARHAAQARAPNST